MIWGRATPVLHVAPHGNDYLHSGGSSCLLADSPCQTIEYAVTRNYRHPWAGDMAGDFVSIAEGTYNETVHAYGARLGAGNWPMLTLRGAGKSTIIAGNGRECATVVANLPGVVSLTQLLLTGTAMDCQSSVFAQLGGIINIYDGVTFGPASQQDVHSESAGSQVQFCASQPRLSASNDPG